MAKYWKNKIAIWSHWSRSRIVNGKRVWAVLVLAGLIQGLLHHHRVRKALRALRKGLLLVRVSNLCASVVQRGSARRRQLRVPDFQRRVHSGKMHLLLDPRADDPGHSGDCNLCESKIWHETKIVFPQISERKWEGGNSKVQGKTKLSVTRWLDYFFITWQFNNNENMPDSKRNLPK